MEQITYINDKEALEKDLNANKEADREQLLELYKNTSKLQRQRNTCDFTYKYNENVEYLLREGNFVEAYNLLIKEEENKVFYRDLIFKIEARMHTEA